MNKRRVIAIKKAINSGDYTQPQLAKKFSVSRSTISDIACGRSHANVGPRVRVVRPAGGQVKTADIEQQNISLIGQVENLRSERNLLNRQLRAASKRLGLVDSVADDLREIVTPLPAPKPFQFKRGTRNLVDETLVLVLSDSHCDEVVDAEETDGLEEFNFPIACRRAEVLIDTAIEFSMQTLCGYKFKNLVILALGDFGSFDLHNHQKRSYFGNSFKSSLAIGQLFAMMYRDLAPYFECIEIVTVSGNHGRITEKIELNKAAHENYDYLTQKIAEVYSSDLENVKFIFPNAFSTMVDIQGHIFHVSHGHTVKSSSAAWARGKKLATSLGDLHNGKIDCFVQGHFHSAGDISLSPGSTLVANGAWLMTDQFAYQDLLVANDPMQWLFGVHKKWGCTWRLPIKIKSKDEAKGPQRYLIEV